MLWNKLLGSSGTRKLVLSTDQKVNVTPASSFTFTGTSVGTAAADRVVLVCVMASGASARTISGVTIGGVSATEATKNTSFRKCTGIYYLTVASGTTATIVVTFSGSVGEMNMGVYSLENWGSVTLHDSGSNTASSGTSVAVSGMDTPALGLEIECVVADAVSFGGGLPISAENAYNTATMSCVCSRLWPTPSATGTTVTRSFTSSDASISVASFS